MYLSAAQRQQSDVATRQRWLSVLAKASLAQLEDAWNALEKRPLYRMLRPAETGLVMLRGRIGGSGGLFNFGEMTVTRAAVQLLDDAGTVSHTGFGHIAGRSARRAELVALFDAVLQDPSQHGAVAGTVVEPLAAAQAAGESARTAKARASKVEFFTMVRGE
jgi:alpha-D-ribose 1-methylphosphonate 5-triphosphate synthase subunit PhnG